MLAEKQKEENFAGQKNNRKAKAKPTASEQRNIQKLFRRKTNKEIVENVAAAGSEAMGATNVTMPIQ